MLIDEIKLILAEQGSLSREFAARVYDRKALPLAELLALTDSLRREHSGNSVRLCSIINARSGGCREDCAFCAQSAHNRAGVPRYGLVSSEEILAAARNAYHSGAGEFSIVTSGPGAGGSAEAVQIETAVSLLRGSEPEMGRCASLGKLTGDELKRLKEKGLDCIHHNLETSRGYFPKICSTHSYDERVEMVRLARENGFRVCSGGIFGLGESVGDRVEMAFELKALGVDSIPINFLNPIKGTRLEAQPLLSPEEALRTIAMFRLVLPERDIVVCGGREVTLGDLQPLLFWAGANGILIGNYLTTSGRNAEDDLKMIRDLGLEPAKYERR